MPAARHRLVASPGARCRHGHDLSIVGVYVAPNGWTACRQCQRDQRARYRKRANRDPIADPHAPDADSVARKAALVHAMLAPEREYRCVDRVPQLVRMGA